MEDDYELGGRAPPLVSVRRCINTNRLPKDHEVDKNSCEVAHASLKWMHVPVRNHSIAEVVGMELPEELSKLVHIFKSSNFPAAKASDGYLHGEDAEEHVQIGSLTNPERNHGR